MKNFFTRKNRHLIFLRTKQSIFARIKNRKTCILFHESEILLIFLKKTFFLKKKLKNSKKSLIFTQRLCCREVLVSDPTPPPKREVLGGSVFLDFFHKFLRWGHTILHADYNGLSGPSDRILAGRMSFLATNRILNFIFLQKFLQFCPFLTIFFFTEPKSNQMLQNFIRWFFRVKRTFRPNFGWLNPISGHQFYFEFW